MLQFLTIENYALIDHLEFHPGQGLTVITGETGAGKSIIMGALGLILGQRADAKAVRSGAGKCVIEAQFNISAYDLEGFFAQNDLEYDASATIIRREIYATGKSRAFVNDTPVQLPLLRELGSHLIDIHSQHQNLLLGQDAFQLWIHNQYLSRGKIVLGIPVFYPMRASLASTDLTNRKFVIHWCSMNFALNR
jgi:DNA repair protein RecN (Recombination protein N)